jgi:hypothetical protein
MRLRASSVLIRASRFVRDRQIVGPIIEQCVTDLRTTSAW